MKIIKEIEKFIKGLENLKIPFIYFVLTFFSATTLRNFIEFYLVANLPDNFIDPLVHFYLSYLCLALTLIILFHFATKEKIEKVSRVVLCCFLIVIIPPIIDLIISPEGKYGIAYLLPGFHENLILRFFTFFGSLRELGVTPGMRIEIALAILGSFIYFYIKKRNLIKSFFFSFLTYCLIFLFCAMPFSIKMFLNVFNLEYNYSSLLMQNFYSILIFLLIGGVFFLYNKKYFMEIIKDIRPFRLLHFELMFILGIILAKIFSPLSLQLPTNALFYLNGGVIMISILFAWLFSVTTNNLVDYKIDKITNKKRPYVSGAIPSTHYKKIALIFFLLALAYALIAGSIILFLIMLFIGNYFFYSMPPLRLKRIIFFSKLLISLNSLILVILGYFFVTKTFDLPVNIVFFFLVFLTASINFIDIKDYKGDKKAGIKTLPVILGLKKSKTIIGFSFLISYSMVYFLLEDIQLLPFLILFGIIQFFLVARKNCKERPVFLVYIISLILIIIYISKLSKV